MISFTHTIKDKSGLHARPAVQLSEKISGFESEVTFSLSGKVASAKNPMALVALCAQEGSVITVSVNGPDEETTAEVLREELKGI